MQVVGLQVLVVIFVEILLVWIGPIFVLLRSSRADPLVMIRFVFGVSQCLLLVGCSWPLPEGRGVSGLTSVIFGRGSIMVLKIDGV